MAQGLSYKSAAASLFYKKISNSRKEQQNEL